MSAVRAKPRLLFVAPVLPAAAGHGLAMRAGLFLEALAARYEVFLLVVPVGAPPPSGPLPSFVASRVSRAVVLDVARRADAHLRLIARLVDPAAREDALRQYPRPLLAAAATSETLAEAAGRFADVRFDVVHVMRLYLAPFAGPWVSRAGAERPRCVLDLDDDEVRTRGSLAALHAAQGDTAAARRETREAERYATFEREHLPRFDRVLVCGSGDRAAVSERLGLGTVAVVPNAVRLPAASLGPRDPRWRLLFVGSLGYLPNADAALVLCREILPRLRQRARLPVEVRIVGTRPPPEIRRLTEIPGVALAANAPRVAPHYAATRVAAAPLRAGGGTRIKLLEAFAHRRPVVTTRVGAEGLEVASGVHLLTAEEPEAFADACLRLLKDDRLADALTEAAWRFAVERHALPVVGRGIRRLYREIVNH